MRTKKNISYTNMMIIHHRMSCKAHKMKSNAIATKNIAALATSHLLATTAMEIYITATSN